MFVLQDMVVEIVVVGVVLLVVLLSVSALATTCGGWLERRRSRESKTRLRRRVWHDYAAACAAAEPRPMTAPILATTRTAMPVRSGVEQRTGLTAGPAKA
jgi:hypothetical protein